MSTGTACQRGLAIPELLEKVLLKLPPLDLLLARRVCHTWQNAIRGSLKIQKALFFEPFDKSPGALLHYYPWYERKAEELPWLDENNKTSAPTLIINPFMDKRFFDENARLPVGDVKYRILPEKWIRHQCDGYERPEASCWKMLFSQQPLDYMEIFCPEWIREFELENAQGIRLDDVEISVFNHLVDCDECTEEETISMSWLGDFEVDKMYDAEVITGEEMLAEFKENFEKKA